MTISSAMSCKYTTICIYYLYAYVYSCVCIDLLSVNGMSVCVFYVYVVYMHGCEYIFIAYILSYA